MLGFAPLAVAPIGAPSGAVSAGATAATAALERYRDQRVTAIHRLDLIEKGATLSYEDGTPVDMASEKRRLEEMVADRDRRIAALERELGLT